MSAPYGSYTRPSQSGSMGGASASYPQAGGQGGGVINITISSTLSLYGILSSTGKNGPFGASGGSGGSIFITTYFWNGNGTMSVNGGSGSMYNSKSGGGGGGGRVAVYFQESTFDGRISAYGGISRYPGGAGTIFQQNNARNSKSLLIDNNGLFGLSSYITSFNSTLGTVAWIVVPEMETTIFDEVEIIGNGHLAFESAPSGRPISIIVNQLRGDLSGTLHIRENQQADLAGINSELSSKIYTYTGSDTTLPNDVILIDFLRISLRGALNNLETLSLYNFSTVEVFSGATLRVLDKLETVQGTTISCAGDLFIGEFENKADLVEISGSISGANIDIRTKKLNIHAPAGILSNGMAQMAGPGAGTISGRLSGGGSYGGSGGARTPGIQGIPYGTCFYPNVPGSSGGRSASIADDTGGKGGGVIRIDADNFTINGNVEARGATGPLGAGSSGGSGGSILILAKTLSGGGSIYANGGPGSTQGTYIGGGGSGGRIALYMESDLTVSFVGGIYAHGGKGSTGPAGGPGTIFVSDSRGESLLIGNNGNEPYVTDVTGIESTTGGIAWLTEDATLLEFDVISLSRNGSLAINATGPIATGQEIFISTGYIAGDRSGTLHVRDKQRLVAQSAQRIESSLRIYSGAEAYLPTTLTIPPKVSSSFFGRVHGVENLLINGTLWINMEGSTTATVAGIYNFSNVLLYAGANLTVAGITPDVYVYANHICLFPGSTWTDESGGLHLVYPELLVTSVPPHCILDPSNITANPNTATTAATAAAAYSSLSATSSTSSSSSSSSSTSSSSTTSSSATISPTPSPPSSSSSSSSTSSTIITPALSSTASSGVTTSSTTGSIPNVCTSNNGGCDFRVECSVTGTGDRICGNCPQGTNGTGITRCDLLCGDNNCDANLGENCVTCPDDCRNTTCNSCGDMFCDAAVGENCTTCFEDCGACKKTCDPNCVQGSCVAGICVCNSGWTDAICSTSQNLTKIVTLTYGGVQPDVSLTTPALIEEGAFEISVHSVTEKTKSGETVRSVQLTNVQFSRVTGQTTGANVMYNYSATVEGGAFVSILVYYFAEPLTTLPFAGTNTTYIAQTLKVNVGISRWPFRALSNSLFVAFDSRLRDNNGASVATQASSREDERGSVTSLTLRADDTALYAQFLDAAVIDGRTRKISFDLDGTRVSAVIPHFWNSAYIDPQYSVLVNGADGVQGPKGKKGFDLRLVYIIVPVVLGSVFIVVFIIAMRPRLNSWWLARRAHTKINSSVELASMEDSPRGSQRL